jgi:hypothetical protein
MMGCLIIKLLQELYSDQEIRDSDLLVEDQRPPIQWYYQTNNEFTGEMEEVRIWNKAKTADEIRQDMCRSWQGRTRGT